MLLCQISIVIEHRKLQKKSYKNIKFKRSAPTWKEKIEKPDRSHYVSDILDFLEIYQEKILRSD